MTERVPALDRVLLEARRARERRGREGDATVRVGPLTEVEARELDALLAATGRRRRVLSGHTLTVPLSRLEAGLEAIGHNPASVYAVLDPSRPVRDRPAERRADARRREEFSAWLLGHPVVAASPPLRAWLDAAQLSGAVRATERATLERALRVVAELPRAAPCDRAVLSAELFGEAHALDDGERAGRLACALLKAAAELPEETPARAVWEHAGALSDTTSSTVLTLGLVPTGDAALAAALRALHGSHVVLTLGQLRASPLEWPVAGTCHSCENPAVLRAAERRLGAACPPLVCTEGWPSDAAALLLRALRDAGWRIRHHGDFDLGGAAIMRHLAAEVGAEPWRFAAEDYEQALAALGRRDLPMLPRGAASGSAARDATVDALGRTIRRRRAVVCEELLIDELLDDLTASMSP